MRDRWYWLRLTRLFVVALIGALVGLPVGLGGLMMWGLTHPGCARGGDPGDYGLPFEEAHFTSPRGHRLSGFFLPGTNRATVLVAPAYGNDRGGDLADAAILNQAGFNVLTFDSGTCAGAPFHSLGLLEAEDAAAAYDYLTSRPGVDPTRIAIHGFSSAGSTSLFTAARLPAIRAVSAKGGYHDFAEQFGLNQHGTVFDRLFLLGADVAYRLVTGLDVRQLSPLEAVAAIAPRRILLIYGSREVSLPGARAMLERANAAGANAELWVVEGAGHGNYLAVAEDAYGERLAAFHRSALLDERG